MTRSIAYTLSLSYTPRRLQFRGLNSNDLMVPGATYLDGCDGSEQIFLIRHNPPQPCKSVAPVGSGCGRAMPTSVNESQAIRSITFCAIPERESHDRYSNRLVCQPVCQRAGGKGA